MEKNTLETIKNGSIKKGDVLGTARIAAIMASKNTHNLIPMCHSIMLTSAKIDFEIDDENNLIKIKAVVKTSGKTGVEMEALMMVSVAGLTIDGSFLTHATWSKLILYNTRAVSGSTITINQHLPSMTVEEFFIELRKIPNLKFDFQTVSRKLTIDFWEDSLSQVAAIDWSSKAVKGETKLPEVRNRLQLGSESDNGDALLKDTPIADYISPLAQGYQYGEIAKVISKFSTLLTDTTTGLAITKQPGVTNINNQITNNFAPRLLFWHGIVSGKPKATNELNNISLLWVGANGLAAKSWAKTEAARAKQFYLKKDFVLRETDLVKLDFSKKIHVAGVDYLIVNLNVDNPIKRVAKCLLLGGV